MLVYSIVGALFGVAVLFIIKFAHSKNIRDGKLYGSIALMVFGALLIAFSLNWAYASIIEGEPQAAAIGFLVFGGIGIVFALLGVRLTSSSVLPKKSPEDIKDDAVA